MPQLDLCLFEFLRLLFDLLFFLSSVCSSSSRSSNSLYKLCIVPYYCAAPNPIYMRALNLLLKEGRRGEGGGVPTVVGWCVFNLSDLDIFALKKRRKTHVTNDDDDEEKT